MKCALLAAFLAWPGPAWAGNPIEADRARQTSLPKKIEELEQAGKYREAIPVAEEQRKLAEKSYGPGDLKTATSLNKLAELYRQAGTYRSARTVAEEAL